VTSDITPLVLTFNEAPNLGRTLEALSWAREVVVLDSGSTDATLDIARGFPNVRVVQRAFDDFASQFSAGAAACRTSWVLALDADHVLSPELVDELKTWQPTEGVCAYFGRFLYCIASRPLRASLYPPRIVLFRQGQCRYVQDGHHQILEYPGVAGWLSGPVLHDDRKPLGRWLADQDRYARMEAEKLSTTRPETLSWADRCRQQVVMAPPLVFLGTLLVKGVIFDGWRGWFYVCQRTIAELMLSLRLAEAKLQKVRRDG
jgi:glycosyltransferase involved in cell wall biosynthesis